MIVVRCKINLIVVIGASIVISIAHIVCLYKIK